ncbi:MAG: methyltransferase [Saprospiraceae bacterium]
MKKIASDSSYSSVANWRFQKTLKFLQKWTNGNESTLDLGPTNPLSELMLQNGYSIKNTPEGTDLDFDFEIVKNDDYEMLTAFEILEHLVSPFPLLYHSKAKKLVASIPLKLWFADAYWSESDPYDRHYHEFEPRQFDMLLEKAGWEIKASEQWKSITNKIGFRPILRRFTPRYYIVYCERK